jgi:hypothetical protein
MAIAELSVDLRSTGSGSSAYRSLVPGTDLYSEEQAGQHQAERPPLASAYLSSSSNALASLRGDMSKPSVNQP